MATSHLRTLNSITWKYLALIIPCSPWHQGEGPPDDNASGATPLPEAILKALVPDANQRNSITTLQVPPSTFNDAFKSKEAFEAALESLRNSADPEVAILPEQYRRIFHPKGSGYYHHSDVNLNAVLTNRQAEAAPSPQPPPSDPNTPAPGISSDPNPPAPGIGISS